MGITKMLLREWYQYYNNSILSALSDITRKISRILLPFIDKITDSSIKVKGYI